MDPYSISGKRILFAPLNWGLGHATRSAKLISNLKENNRITLASDGTAFDWLKKEFPDLPIILLPELKMRYSKYFGAAGGVLFRLRHFIASIKRDYKATQKIIREGKYDLIISDNRYGVYAEDVESVLITHQLNFSFSFSSIFELPLQNLLEKFNSIWIPDDADRRCSGLLGKPEKELKVPIEYIGPLSRFSNSSDASKDIKFTLIASGPEPFRSQLIDYFYKNFSLLNEKCCVVCGAETKMVDSAENVILYNMLNSKDLEEVMDRSEYIICRSGYSSIMDLIKKDQKAILIPTPNQPEQEYLADFHSSNPLFESVLNGKDLPNIMKQLL